MNGIMLFWVTIKVILGYHKERAMHVLLDMKSNRRVLTSALGRDDENLEELPNVRVRPFLTRAMEVFDFVRVEVSKLDNDGVVDVYSTPKRRMVMTNLAGMGSLFDDDGNVIREDVDKFTAKDTWRDVFDLTSWAYTIDSNLYRWFVKVNDEFLTNWDLFYETYGIIVRNKKKLAKRLTIFTNDFDAFTRRKVNLVEEDWADGEINAVDIDNGSNPLPYDGRGGISDKLAISMIRESVADKKKRRSLIRGIKRGKITLGQLRGLIPNWMMKMDVIIVPQKQLEDLYGKGCNMAFLYSENLKDDLGTDGTWQCVAMDFSTHPTTPPRADILSTSWLRDWLYPLDEMATATEDTMNEILNGIAIGEYPEYLDKVPHARDEEAISTGEEELSDTILNNSHRWMLHFRDHSIFARLYEFLSGDKFTESPFRYVATLPYLVMNGFFRTMCTPVRRHDDYNAAKPWKHQPKLNFLIPHSTFAYVMTWDLLEALGYDLSEYNTDLIGWHAETQTQAVPGKFFIENNARAGGWDLDDKVRFHLRWANIEVPFLGTMPMLIWVLVRIPNSDGEYSFGIADVDHMPPIYHTHKDIPWVDMDERPAQLAMETLVGSEVNYTITGLPDNLENRDTKFTELEAARWMFMSAINPNIGQVANALMTIYSMGIDVPVMIDSLEEVVDTIKQAPHIAALTAINAWIADLWDYIVTSDVPIDEYMARAKVSPKRRKEMTVIRRGNDASGYWNKAWDEFTRLRTWYHKESRELSVFNRVMIPGMADMDFSHVEEDVVKLITWYERRGTERPGWDADMAAAFDEKTAELMIRGLLNKDKADRDDVLLGTYKYIHEHVKEKRSFRFNRTLASGNTVPATHEYFIGTDKILFSRTVDIDGTRMTTMDLFLEALVDAGLAQPVEIIDGEVVVGSQDRINLDAVAAALEA